MAKIFEDRAANLGVIFHTDAKISDIKEMTKKYDAVVVATGSRAAEHLGGNADGEAFAKEFGHNVLPAYPSLVQLRLKSGVARKMSGAKLSSKATLFINRKKDVAVEGDVLFTDYGVSGFAILDLSQRASFALMNKESVELSINLLPSFDAQTLSAHISKVAQNFPDFTMLDILVGLVPVKIANGLLEELNFSSDTKAKEVHAKTSKRLANAMLDWRFEVNDTHGFRHAEVSGGGIDTSEINPKTMESLKRKNLYFCGEVLDVLGKRGGYNFAFAWASGYLAAKDITKR